MMPGERTYLWQWQRDRYRVSWLTLCPTEADIQAAAIERLSFLGIPVLAVDVGAKKLRGRAFRALKAAGVSRASQALKGQTGAGVEGLSDIIGVIPPEVHGLGGWGIPLFLECKKPEWMEPGSIGFVQKQAAGKPTPDQLAFLDAMHQAHACVGVIWSVDDLSLALGGFL